MIDEWLAVELGERVALYIFDYEVNYWDALCELAIEMDMKTRKPMCHKHCLEEPCPTCYAYMLAGH